MGGSNGEDSFLERHNEALWRNGQVTLADAREMVAKMRRAAQNLRELTDELPRVTEQAGGLRDDHEDAKRWRAIKKHRMRIDTFPAHGTLTIQCEIGDRTYSVTMKGLAPQPGRSLADGDDYDRVLDSLLAEIAEGES